MGLPHPDEDKHKAPTSTQPLPLSLQDVPDACVPTLMITLFGWKNSLGANRQQ